MFTDGGDGDGHYELRMICLTCFHPLPIVSGFIPFHHLDRGQREYADVEMRPW